MSDTLPRQYARTRGFSLGLPRSFTISPDGDRVLFLRSRHGSDPVTCLWELDITQGRERLIVDPGDAAEELPPEETIRRERVREQSRGVTTYTTDHAVTRAAYALSGRLWLVDLEAARVRELPAAGLVVTPRLSPDGSAIAYVSGGSLRIIDTDGTDHSADRALATPEGRDVTYGRPEHVAAESMGRHRGFWWAPDSARLLIARVDDTPVRRLHLSNPADPGSPPVERAYPIAG
ncbi:MAG TPA: DPP IV N-terminal domain-containing protein, partial [Nonomuraea sp.]|nr:DPP IV N-terminal domain-containing protein [Nonomuraea sp.]